jgi:hypothetical protein
MKNYLILKVIICVLVCSTSTFAQQKYETEHVAIVSEIFDKQTLKSFARSIEEARGIAVDNGFGMPERVTLRISQKQGIDKMIMVAEGQDTIQLYYPDETSFRAKIHSHNTNTYGVSHEIGHMIIGPLLGDADEFSIFVMEGWAHLFGSMVNDMIYQKHKKTLWANQLDYREYGMKRFLQGLSAETHYGQVQLGWLELCCKVGLNNMSGFLTDLDNLIEKRENAGHALAIAVYSYLGADEAQNWIKQYSGAFLNRSNESISLYALYVQQYY